MKDDLSGKVYGRLTVLSRAEKTTDGRWKWLCKCECGFTTKVLKKHLVSGHSKSCGCLRKKHFVDRNTSHGHCTGRRSPTYEVWQSMWQRCTNSKHKHFKYYGGRGIMVCEEWMRFETFLEDMGIRPEGMTLDRRENNGHYEKGNCRWVEWYVQVENRRRQTRGETNEDPATPPPAVMPLGFESNART